MPYHHYPQTEQDDADRVDRAVELIDDGQTDEARSLLEQIVANCPELYVYNFGDESEICIKFWALDEYLGYVGLTREAGEQVEQEVIWLRSAYPRAYYYLARLAVTAGDDAAAMAHLDNALRLEPDHPQCLVELAELHARAGDGDKSLEQFEQTLGSRPYMSGTTMARALNGKAKQLVQSGRFDDAEQCLHESLKHGPDNELAVNILRYVEAVKAGNVKPPVSIDDLPDSGWEPPPPQEERPVESEPTAQEPEPTHPKRWWQPWK